MPETALGVPAVPVSAIPAPAPLIERGAEVAAVGAAIEAACAGAGTVVVVRGPPGCGKTTLLRMAASESTHRSLRTAFAQGSELERTFAFGLVQQLVAPPGFDLAEGSPHFAGAARHARTVLGLGTASPAADIHVAVHGLYWLLANIAAQAPLVVLVDDLQWADDESLALLAYLARRVADMPICMVVSLREDGATGNPAIRAIETAAAVSLAPDALSVVGVERLVGAVLGEPVGRRFAVACHDLSAGNPFLARELVAALADAGVRPIDGQAAAVRAVLPARVTRFAEERLAGLSASAQALAEAVCVLGDDCDLLVAGELAELPHTSAGPAAAELAAARLTDNTARLSFSHPLIRRAITQTIPETVRAQEHRRAAAVFAAHHAPPGRIAAQLVAAAGGHGDPWVVDRLRDAARAALEQGATARACEYLTRALAEPPGPSTRVAVLRELGDAELGLLRPEAADHLAEALTATPRTNHGERATLALALALARYYAGDHRGAVAVLIEEIGRLRAPAHREQRLRLEAFLGVAGRYDLTTEENLRGRVHTVAQGLAGATPGERLVMAVAALEAGDTATDLARAATLEEAAVDELRWPDPSEGVGTVAMYIYAGRSDEAARLANRLVDRARVSNSPLRHAVAVSARGIVAFDVGDLPAATADLTAAVETMSELGALAIAPTVGYLVQALSAAGAYAAAEQLLVAHGLDGDLPRQMLLNPVLFGRGALRVEQGAAQTGLADLLELGRRHQRWDMRRPSPPWRSTAAVALMAVGDNTQAQTLVDEEIAVATRWGAAKPIAVARRVAARLEPDPIAIATLRDVDDLLAPTPWRLERARVGIELGAALRRAGQRREARDLLTRAMDLAHGCGAEPLAARAVRELRASGARPRRRSLSGRDALTPSERQVADLAAAGLSNREIAQALFVTSATVETHLTRTYRKLGIPGRGGLTDALTVRGQANETSG